MKIDVTKKVGFENPDDEYLPITRCICGAEFDLWEHSISIYSDNAKACPKCGAKLYFENSIKIYMVA